MACIRLEHFATNVIGFSICKIEQMKRIGLLSEYVGRVLYMMISCRSSPTQPQIQSISIFVICLMPDRTNHRCKNDVIKIIASFGLIREIFENLR